MRRRESIHKRLAREGGLEQRGERPVDPRPGWGEVGIHGVARAREWDFVGMADAEIRGGDTASFVALPDGAIVIESGPDDVAPLAEAVERSLAAPYRAEAVRRPDGAWAVAARRIRVLDLPEVDGDALELTSSPDGKRLLVDGLQVFGSAPALESLLGGRDGVVQATRIDGAAFEVVVHPL